MKSVKVGFMIGFLLMSSNLFCELDRSMDQATTDLYHTTVSAIRAAMTIGVSSYVVDFLLSCFKMTSNLEFRGALATGSCAALYALFLISAEYQRMSGSTTQDQKRGFPSVDDVELIEDAKIDNQEDDKN